MLPYILLRQRFTVLHLNNRRLQYNRECVYMSRVISHSGVSAERWSFVMPSAAKTRVCVQRGLHAQPAAAAELCC